MIGGEIRAWWREDEGEGVSLCCCHNQRTERIQDQSENRRSDGKRKKRQRKGCEGGRVELAGFEEETCREKGKTLVLCSIVKEKDVRMSNTALYLSVLTNPAVQKHIQEPI